MGTDGFVHFYNHCTSISTHSKQSYTRKSPEARNAPQKPIVYKRQKL